MYLNFKTRIQVLLCSICVHLSVFYFIHQNDSVVLIAHVTNKHDKLLSIIATKFLSSNSSH